MCHDLNAGFRAAFPKTGGFVLLTLREGVVVDRHEAERRHGAEENDIAQ